MNEIECAIQELEDMAHHKSLKKQLSDAALVEALKALHQADQLAEKDKQLSASESRMNKAFAIANNAIYFADSSDYLSALFDCGVALFPEVDEYDVGRSFIDERGMCS